MRRSDQRGINDTSKTDTFQWSQRHSFDAGEVKMAAGWGNYPPCKCGIINVKRRQLVSSERYYF